MNEEIIFIGSAIAGSILTVAIDKLAKPTFSKASPNAAASYDTVKSELDSLEFERDLLAESTIKVNAAFNEKRIDVYERDKLLQRYARQMEHYEEKIEQYQNLLEFEDLRIQRDRLIDVINKRVSSIDERLREIRDRLAITHGDREGETIEQGLEEEVQEAIHDDLHNFKHIDEPKKVSTPVSSTHDPSQPLVGNRTETDQLEELHLQIKRELDRLESEKEGVDDTLDVDAAGNAIDSLLAKGKEASKKGVPTSSSLDDLKNQDAGH